MSMNAKVHFIHLKDSGDLDRFTRELKGELYDTARDLATPLKEKAYEFVTYRLRKGGTIGFEEDLKRSVGSMTYKSGLRSRIHINPKAISGSKDTTVDVAKMNEFGTTVRYVKAKGNPKLQRWMKEKGIKGSSVKIGGDNSRVKLGKSSNWFWQPTFITMQKRAPSIFADAFVKRFK